MAVQRILQLGDPVLRLISTAVLDGETARRTLADLRDTLHDFQARHGFGRGISAIHSGRPERVSYIEFAGVAYELVNPQWQFLSPEKFVLWDDCFSFPELLVLLERSEHVKLHHAGGVLEAKGAFAELLQHEMDHLDGILAVDRALPGNSLATRAEWLRQQAAAR